MKKKLRLWEETMKIRSEIFEIPGAPLEGVNPLPSFRSRNPVSSSTTDRFPAKLKETLGRDIKVLPYLMQDRYSRKRLPLKLKSFVLENKYLKARFLPEYGGRLHSLYDKIHGEDLVFVNPVIQPGNLAIRNAWLSGGIEWNIGNIGHTYTTCDNVFCAILQDPDGNDFLRIYEFERLKSIFWQVDFHLPDDSPYLITHVKMINPFDEDTTTYWWSNVAVPDTGKTRVLSSGKNVISFTGGCDYEVLPHIDAMPGVDVTYPSRATRSFDYFIQENYEGESTWEAAAYENGLVFYERSTAPLYYKKLFAWGKHRAGKRWQEFLSDGEGTGYYAEIQAGIAPSQLHDKILPAKGIYEWTQVFGGIKLEPERLFCEDFDAACGYFGENLGTIVTSDSIYALNEKLKPIADQAVAADDLVHMGSGFGAVEAMRMKLTGDGEVPASMCFPKASIGKAQYPWVHLLENGVLPTEDVRTIPDSYMIGKRWIPLMKSALEKTGGRTWYSLYHLGTAVYEVADLTKVANSAFDEEENKRQTEEARALWQESADLAPNAWAYRNLAILALRDGNNDEAERYYDLAMAVPGAFDDFALASEYLGTLTGWQKFEKAWSLFESMPDNCRSVDRIRITAAGSALKLDKLDWLDGFFREEHHDIREGECSLTDLWFEFCARKMAKERGVDVNDEAAMQILLDEAWDNCPPDPAIDFRMSFDKNLKYRI